MGKILTHDDIKDFLINLSAAIELDQIRVDACRVEGFTYDDQMWRNWRRTLN